MLPQVAFDHFITAAENNQFSIYAMNYKNETSNISDQANEMKTVLKRNTNDPKYF